MTPVGYRRGNVDFDDIFEPYASGPKVPPTGMRHNGIDLCERYAALQLGSQAAATGHRIASNADANTLWAAKGSVAYTLGFHGGAYSGVAQALSGQTGIIGASSQLSINSNGQWSIASGPIPQESGPRSGAWLTSGTASQYQVRFTLTGPEGTVSNSAPDWTSLSAGQGVAVSAQVEAASTDIATSETAVLCEIRRASDGVILTATTCTIYAEARGQV